MVAAVVLLACGLGVLVPMAFVDVGAGFAVIGTEDAPLVEESTGLYFLVNDMDAQVANVLLTGNDRVLGADRQQDLDIYAKDRRQAEQDLQKITVTTAADPAAQRAVSSVLDALGRYEALASEAILLDQRGADPAGQPSADVLQYYRQATDLMRTEVLPAADSLTNANANTLNAIYLRKRNAEADGHNLVGVLGLVLLGVLAGLQAYVARHYRRMLNPALIAATLLAAVLVIAAMVQLGDQAFRLNVAKQEAFGSILALTRARAVSHDANADESRYLVDPGRAAEYQEAFLDKSQQLADVGDMGNVGDVGDMGDATYEAALVARYISAFEAGDPYSTLDGYLGSGFELNAFPGEHAAAVKTLLAYQVYQQDDERLWAMAQTNLDQAIAFDIGTSPGQSDWAFNNFDTALTAAIAIDENAFAAAIKHGDDTASRWTGVVPALAVVAIAGLTVAGTWRRIREYR